MNPYEKSALTFVDVDGIEHLTGFGKEMNYLEEVAGYTLTHEIDDYGFYYGYKSGGVIPF